MVYLLNKASKLHDSSMLKLVKSFLKIPKNIKTAVLREFLTKCENLHKVAFFQWRLKFCEITEKQKQMLDELVEESIVALFSDIKTKSSEPVSSSPLPESISKYKLLDKKYSKWNINSFNQIGIREPFPNDIDNRYIQLNEDIIQ